MGILHLVGGPHDSALKKYLLDCVPGGEDGSVRQKYVEGTKEQGLGSTGHLTARETPRGGSAGFGVVVRTAIVIPALTRFSSVSGLFLRGCGAIFGKYQHRGFLWPCSGPSFLSLFATVCFTGPCTLTQLLTLISWSRKSDGWKPKCFDWHCPGPEGLSPPP